MDYQENQNIKSKTAGLEKQYLPPIESANFQKKNL
jgi:hypothetical protein